MHVLLLSAGKILRTPFGGEDLFSRSLGKWLAKMQKEVTLMGIEYAGMRVKHLTYLNVNSNNEPVGNIEKKKNKVKKPVLGYLFYSLRTIIWIFQVLKILAINVTKPISIIHAQDSGYTGLAAIVAGKILGIPVIITMHGIRYEQIESNPVVNKVIKKIALRIERKLDVLTLGNADLITIVSSTMKQYVQKIIAKSSVNYIPVAIKTKNFEYSEEKREMIRNELGIHKDIKIVGFVGRLSYEKNLSTLLYSFADAVNNNLSLKLVLVGEGPLEYELRKQTRDIHIDDRVIFCGFRDDIDELLSGFDIFVLPSLIEGTSHALLEAMTCGRSIICSDIPANRELVTNNKNALLFNPNDNTGLSAAIMLLSTDEMLRRKLGYNAKIVASQYDEEIVFPKFVQCYHGLCEKKE